MSAGVVRFILANLVVGLGAASSVARLRLRDTLDRALAFAVLCLSQVVVSLLIAGAVLHRFETATVLWMNLALTALAAGLSTVKGGGQGVVHRPSRPTGGGWAWARRAARTHPWETALAVLAAAALAWRALVAYVLPPYDYDGLWYHLTTVAGWVQSGDLDRSPLVLWSAVYPANGELAFSWPLLLSDSDTWVNGVQLGFVVLGAASMAGLARLTGATPPTAVAAGALFALTPVVLAQSSTNYVDVMIAATFLTSLYFMLRFLNEVFSGRHPPSDPPSSGLLVASGLAAGFALGTKATGVVYVGAIALVLVVALGSACLRGAIVRSTVWAALVAFAVPVVVVGGFWYGRNLVDFGNPFYPVKVELLGAEIFPGKFTPGEVANSLPPRDPGDRPEWLRVGRSWAHDLAPWSHPGAEYYSEEHRNGGFGMQWVYLELPALGLLGLEALGGRRARLTRLIRPLGRRMNAFAILFAIALVVVLGPYKWWSRWTIVLAAAGALALASVVERARAPALGTLLRGATLVLVGTSLWYATAAIPANYGRLVRPAEIVRLSTAEGELRTIGALFLPDYSWVDAIEPDARIGVILGSTPATGAFSYFFYPLFGPELGHRIVAVDAGDQTELARRARAAGVDYLFLRNDSQALLWAREDPSDFRLVSPGTVFSAFAVVPGTGDAAVVRDAGTTP